MFRVNEANNGRGVLLVEEGKMNIHISLSGKKIVNLYLGKAENAKTDEDAWLNPVEDEIIYRDGTKETVFGFDVPVPYLDKEFDLALIGTKGVWYDHKVRVTDVK